MCCTNYDYPQIIHMKCLPFGGTSTVPILEEFFDNESKKINNFIVDKDLKDQTKIKKVVDILSKVTEQKPVKLDDYDIRASLGLDGKPDRYYFNWDRKHLIYKSNIYPISKSDFETLGNLVDLCPK